MGVGGQTSCSPSRTTHVSSSKIMDLVIYRGSDISADGKQYY